jgi:predicted ABC-type ATPase
MVRLEERDRCWVLFLKEKDLGCRAEPRLIPQWRKKGFSVKLVFLKLPNSEMAIARVAARIAQGGHTVPEEVIRRRFVAGWRNFQEIYRPLVNVWIL